MPIVKYNSWDMYRFGKKIMIADRLHKTQDDGVISSKGQKCYFLNH